jgi:hypothetical protein
MTGYRSVIDAARKRLADRERRVLRDPRFGEIEHAEWGEGPPMLLSHPLLGGFDMMASFAETYIGAGHRFVAPSRFGYLGSSLLPAAVPADQVRPTARERARLEETIDSLFPIRPRKRGVLFDLYVSNPDVQTYPLEEVSVPHPHPQRQGRRPVSIRQRCPGLYTDRAIEAGGDRPGRPSPTGERDPDPAGDSGLHQVRQLTPVIAQIDRL